MTRVHKKVNEKKTCLAAQEKARNDELQKLQALI